MNVRDINHHLLHGDLGAPALFPHLEALEQAPFVFRLEFGLSRLPEAPGLISVRGPRQYGKSTWLEGELRRSAADHGPATEIGRAHV